jgi:hypothetical protein
MAAPPPATQLPTRQQLDEIDALLSRMLTLPPLGGEAAADTPAAPPVKMTFPAPLIREVPAPQPPAPGAPVVQEWRVQWPQDPTPAPPPSVVAWGSPVPLATPADDPYVSPPAPAYQPPVYTPLAYVPPVGQFPVAEPVAADPRPVPARLPVPAVLWPLVAVNVAFNLLCYLLGPPGSWLRGSGRTVLGYLGVGMIVAAGVWAAGEWYGYDWPKVDVSGFDLSRLGLSR